MSRTTCLTPEYTTGIIEAMKRQLQTLADKLKDCTERPASDMCIRLRGYGSILHVDVITASGY